MPNRADTPPEAVSDVDLRDALSSGTKEERGVADRLARLEGDRKVLEVLQASGFDGKDWRYFQDVLASYGLAVIRAWLWDRSIFDQCARKGFGGLPRPPRQALDDPDTVMELAVETVAVALDSFRRTVLVPGRWDPRKGASIRTYFIGHCLLKFPNIYRAWYKAEVPEGELLIADHEVLDAFVEYLEGPEKLIADRDLVSRLLGVMPNTEARRAFVLIALGKTQVEIAVELHTTTKAVERMLDRARQQARRAA